MKSITIHKIDDTLEKRILEFAGERGTSLNRAMKILLKKALNIDETDRRADFEEFCGIWKEKDFNNFNKSIESFSRVNPEDWK